MDLKTTGQLKTCGVRLLANLNGGEQQDNVLELESAQRLHRQEIESGSIPDLSVVLVFLPSYDTFWEAGFQLAAAIVSNGARANVLREKLSRAKRIGVEDRSVDVLIAKARPSL